MSTRGSRQPAYPRDDLDYQKTMEERYFGFLLPCDPFRTQLPRASLFEAIHKGDEALTNPRSRMYTAPKALIEPAVSGGEDAVARSLADYLESFTIPRYDEMWIDELADTSASIPQPAVVPPKHNPFDAYHRSNLNSRLLLNKRKIDHWDIRIWSYTDSTDYHNDQPTLFFGTVFPQRLPFS